MADNVNNWIKMQTKNHLKNLEPNYNFSVGKLDWFIITSFTVYYHNKNE